MNARNMTPTLKQARWRRHTSASERWEGRTRVQGEASRRAWNVFLGNVPWETSLTLTVDPHRWRYDVSRETMSRETFKLCGIASYAVGKPVAWVYATERHSSGRW